MLAVGKAAAVIDVAAEHVLEIQGERHGRRIRWRAGLEGLAHEVVQADRGQRGQDQAGLEDDARSAGRLHEDLRRSRISTAAHSSKRRPPPAVGAPRGEQLERPASSELM